MFNKISFSRIIYINKNLKKKIDYTKLDFASLSKKEKFLKLKKFKKEDRAIIIKKLIKLKFNKFFSKSNNLFWKTIKLNIIIMKILIFTTLLPIANEIGKK